MDSAFLAASNSEMMRYGGGIFEWFEELSRETNLLKYLFSYPLKPFS